MNLQLRSRVLDLSAPVVMGVLNVTPDSFSDGGRFQSIDAAVEHARKMLAQGAALIDVGGESTRPGAAPVPEQDELDRIIPLIERLVRELGCIVSVDTMKPGVMRAACGAGAELINDVNALRAPGALAAAAGTGAGVVLMHMRGGPATMQQAPQYDDVVGEVKSFLAERVAAALGAGISRNRIAIDPGFGFGKTLEHNLRLLGSLQVLADTGLPVLAGLSRKSMFQGLLGLPVDQRTTASAAAAALAVHQGAVIVRAHDVPETLQAVRVADAVRRSSNK